MSKCGGSALLSFRTPPVNPTRSHRKFSPYLGSGGETGKQGGRK